MSKRYPDKPGWYTIESLVANNCVGISNYTVYVFHMKNAVKGEFYWLCVESGSAASHPSLSYWGKTVENWNWTPIATTPNQIEFFNNYFKVPKPVPNS